MRLAVLGSGSVARALAEAFRESGHDVSVGSREPDRADLREWAEAHGVATGLHAAVAAEADVVLLVTAWDGVEQAVQLAGPSLAGRVLVDVTNPLVFDGELSLALGHTDSGAEFVQRLAPEAHVVKAFNTVGYELMNRPTWQSAPGTMFIAGDSPDAKATVAELAHELGWGVHDAGGLSASRLLEPVALVWINHFRTSGSRTHAYAFVEATPS